MSPTGRTLIAFAAIGAGLIHFALAIGSPVGVAAILAIVGMVEFAFALVTMAIGRLLAPRAVLGAALAPVVLWTLAIFAFSSTASPDVVAALRFVPLAIAAAFELFIAGSIALHLRRAVSTHATFSTGRYLRGTIAGGLVIAAFTLGALSATGAASLVAPSGSFTDEHGH